MFFLASSITRSKGLTILSNKSLHKSSNVSLFIDILNDMLNEAEDTKYYDTIETIDRNDYVYVGIEVGIPTVDMIKE